MAVASEKPASPRDGVILALSVGRISRFDFLISGLDHAFYAESENLIPFRDDQLPTLKNRRPLSSPDTQYAASQVQKKAVNSLRPTQGRML